LIGERGAVLCKGADQLTIGDDVEAASDKRLNIPRSRCSASLDVDLVCSSLLEDDDDFFVPNRAFQGLSNDDKAALVLDMISAAACFLSEVS
jgi:hypothetical protein